MAPSTAGPPHLYIPDELLKNVYRGSDSNRNSISDLRSLMAASRSFADKASKLVTCVLAEDCVLPPKAFTRFPAATGLVIRYKNKAERRSRYTCLSAVLAAVLPSRIQQVTITPEDPAPDPVDLNAGFFDAFAQLLPAAAYANLRRLTFHTAITPTSANLLLTRLPALQQLLLVVTREESRATGPYVLSSFPASIIDLDLQIGNTWHISRVVVDASGIAACKRLRKLCLAGNDWQLRNPGSLASCAALETFELDGGYLSSAEQDTLFVEVSTALGQLHLLRSLNLASAIVESRQQWRLLASLPALEELRILLLLPLLICDDQQQEEVQPQQTIRTLSVAALDMGCGQVEVAGALRKMLPGLQELRASQQLFTAGEVAELLKGGLQVVQVEFIVRRADLQGLGAGQPQQGVGMQRPAVRPDAGVYAAAVQMALEAESVRFAGGLEVQQVQPSPGAELLEEQFLMLAGTTVGGCRLVLKAWTPDDSYDDSDDGAFGVGSI